MIYCRLRSEQLRNAVLLASTLFAPTIFSENAQAQYDGCESLGSALVDHGCFHAQFGPYQAVTGAPGTTGTAPNINTVHTQYTVTLTNGSGSVTYRPARAGYWTIMTDPNIPTTVLDPSGASVPVVLTDESTGCGQLPVARVYNFAANTVYRFVFGPSSASTVDIVMEKLSDFEAFYYRDADGDTFGSTDDAFSTACAAPAGRVDNDADCNDSNAAVNPAASETANGLDDNCNGEIDEGTAPLLTFYRDADGDGYGNPSDSQQGTTAPQGYVSNDDDCNDSNAAVNPAATETANELDDDCNGEVDEGAGSSITYYRDADGDGFGNPSESQQAPTAPPGFVENDDDCDDNNTAANPDAEEVCDQIDNDCNGEIDDLDDALGAIIEHACRHAELGPFETIDSGSDLSAPHTAYTVNLSGSEGSYTGSANFEMFEAGEKFVMLGADVSIRVRNEVGEVVDAERSVNAEGCDALAKAYAFDLEAGWYVIEFGPTSDSSVMVVLEAGHHDHEEHTLYADADGDGFGDPAHPLHGCGTEQGVENADDCNDGKADINPEAEEVCDQVDNDCDGTVDTLEGASVCDASCGPAVLVARQSYRPKLSQPGHIAFSQPTSLRIPHMLRMQSGCALGQRATMRVETSAGRTVKCDYLGIGNQYRLLQCSNRVRGGGVVEVRSASLSVSGLAWCGPTEVRLRMGDEVCEPSQSAVDLNAI